MQIGLDFGTTNSGAAWFDGQEVHLMPLDHVSATPAVLRSVLYVTRDHRVLVGKEAIDTYYRQNTGRPKKLVRQYVGQLEQIYSDGLSVVEDVFARIDELSPGRLLRSLKSELAGGYEGTRIFERIYTLEDLVALFLREIRLRVEAHTGRHVDGVMMGRPVHFVGSDEGGSNEQATRRLRQAARQAGFDQVSFELEPVAAAIHYGLSLERPQNILIFDFGGGTLDVTVMRVGEPSSQEIFATGGVGIAGDAFDRRIVAELLLSHLGQNATYGDKGTPFPAHYTDAVLNWQSIMELHNPETLHYLRRVQMHCSHPARVRALESLIVNDEGTRLFDRVEVAKIELSSERFAVIKLRGEDIQIWQPLTRAQFEALIDQEVGRIQTCVLDTVARSGLEIEQIDAVVRTGGSSQIPGFISMLGDIFSPEKVVLSEVFSGVTAGLAVSAALAGN